MALVPTVINIGKQEARQDGRSSEAGQVNGAKGKNYTARFPTVIGVGEQESRQDGRSGETGQVDGSKHGIHACQPVLVA